MEDNIFYVEYNKSKEEENEILKLDDSFLEEYSDLESIEDYLNENDIDSAKDCVIEGIYSYIQEKIDDYCSDNDIDYTNDYLGFLIKKKKYIYQCMGLKKTLKGEWKGIDIVLNTFYIERNLMMNSSVNVRFKDYPNMDPVAYIKSHPEEFKKKIPAKTFKNNYSKRNSNTSSTYHLNKKEKNLLGNVFAYVILGVFVLLCMVMC